MTVSDEQETCALRVGRTDQADERNLHATWVGVLGMISNADLA